MKSQRKGFSRLWYALHYSLQGLHRAWFEPAFRQEVGLFLVLTPVAWWIGKTWVEWVLLIGSIVLLMIVELLNTAIEAVVDRVGSEWHELSKMAKDIASAAVFLACLLCMAVWLFALISRLNFNF